MQDSDRQLRDDSLNELFAAFNHYATTWTLRATRPDGSRIEAAGIDLFTLRGHRVAAKSAFRKDRPPLRA